MRNKEEDERSTNYRDRALGGPGGPLNCLRHDEEGKGKKFFLDCIGPEIPLICGPLMIGKRYLITGPKTGAQCLWRDNQPQEKM